MDMVEQSGVKVPNSVIVSGLTWSERDEYILDVLKQYGSINRTLKIDDPSSEFHLNLIVEYNYGTAMQALESFLPYTQPLPDDPDVTFQVRALAGLYTKKSGSSVTQSYLGKLREIAKLSGRNFEEVLKEVMSQIEDSIEGAEPSEHDASPPHSVKPELAAESSHNPGVSDASHNTVPSSRSKPAVKLTPHELNPPDVQKIVVEHIVRNEDKFSHFHPALRLRAFSGKTPRPYSEVDYDTWRSHVDLMMKDPAVSDLEKSRRIIESLLIPASDVIRHLGPEAPPTAYLQMLDSAFATVEDGEELFARFMNTLQDAGEKPSTYLQRLQVALNNAVRRGGVPMQEVDKHLLKQFCRGCWDNNMLADLQLEHKKQNPPSFAELLLLLRTEEDRQEAKATRMKRHLGGSVRQKTVMHVQNVSDCSTSQTRPDTSILELKKQVADLKNQLTFLMKKMKSSKVDKPKITEAKKPDYAKTGSPSRSNTQSKPKPWYCFRCGEDGHIIANCEFDANPALVAAKRKELRQRQQLWETQNTQKPQLN